MKAIFDAFFRYYCVILSPSRRIESVDINNCPEPKIYYFDFKNEKDESNIS